MSNHLIYVEKPADKRHALSRHVNGVFHDASDCLNDIPQENTREKAKARYDVIHVARDRAPVYLVTHFENTQNIYYNLVTRL